MICVYRQNLNAFDLLALPIIAKSKCSNLLGILLSLDCSHSITIAYRPYILEVFQLLLCVRERESQSIALILQVHKAKTFKVTFEMR